MIKKNKKKAVIILSGGMDSVTLLYDLINKNYEVTAISFDYNQKHKKELVIAKKITKKLNVNHKIFNLIVLNQIAPSALTRKNWKVPHGHFESDAMKQTIVHNRNMIMLSLAGSFAMSIGIKELFYGAHSGDHAI